MSRSVISTSLLFILALVVLSQAALDEEQLSDDDNEAISNEVDYEENESETSQSGVKSKDSGSFREYQSLLINDVQIDLEYWEGLDEKPSLLVHYKDDVQFECNIPRDKFTGGYDWSLNGKYLTHNDSVYSIILDRNIDKDLKVLNFSCHFISPSRNKMVSLHFPLLEISDYYFQGGVPYQEYLLQKYRRQLKILNIGIVVIIFFGITTAVIAWINRSILKKKDQNLQYVLAPS